MKRVKKIILGLSILAAIICFAQIISSCNSETSSVEECDIIIDIPQSEKPDDLETMLAGVNCVVINQEEKSIQHHRRPIFNAVKEYLEEMGFEKVEYLNNFSEQKTLCGCIYFQLDFRAYYKYYDIRMRFYNRIGCSWEFSTDKIVTFRGDKATKSDFKQVLNEMYGNKKPDFNSDFTINLAKKQTCWTETKLKDIMRAKGCDEIEGIYENTKSSKDMAKYKVAVRKMHDTYYLIYLSGAHNSGDWTEGEIKATLEATAVPQYYKAKWIMANKSENSNYYITFEQNKFDLLSDSDTTSYIKMFPSATDKIKRRK